MADIPQVLATYDALVGVALGAGLTYGFGALNRRHQEKREDSTRWYEKRLQAYDDLYRVAYDAQFTLFGGEPSEAHAKFAQKLFAAVGTIHFVGSSETIEAAEKVLDDALEELGDNVQGGFINALELFRAAARKDLGHPSP
jgi:hypothetical protein